MSEAHTTSGPVDLRALLATPTDEFERPKMVPLGHYIGRIIGTVIDRAKNEKQTPYLRLELAFEEACDDILESDLVGINLSRASIRKDYYMVPSSPTGPGSMWRIRDMLDAVTGEQIGRSLQERITELKDARVMFKVIDQTDRQGNKTGYRDVDTVIAAP